MKGTQRVLVASALLVIAFLGQTAGASAQGVVILIDPEVVGTLGDNGWYTSDVTVTWPVPADADTGSLVGCEETTIDFDTPPEGVSLFCTGMYSGSLDSFVGGIIIKRDATPPQASANLSSDPDQPTPLDEGDSLAVDASSSLDAASGLASILWDLDGDGTFEAPNLSLFSGIDGIAQGDLAPDWLVAQVADQAGNLTQATF
jgi:hypothetical protein